MEIERKYATIRNPLACLDSDAPSLGIIQVHYGRAYLSAYLEAWILSTQDFFNISKPMGPTQISATASLLIDEYPALNLADVNLIFRNAKLGTYGELYNRLDGQVVLGWFRKYFDERCNAAAERSMQEGDRYKHLDMERIGIRVQLGIKRMFTKKKNGKSE